MLVNKDFYMNMASDWLEAVQPANQKPCLKILLTSIDFNLQIS